MKVLVTGASGFVGQAVVEECRAAGHTVVGLSRRAPVDAKIPWIECDLSSVPLPVEITEFEVIVHCAGLAHAGKSDDSAYERNISEATRNLLTAAEGGLLKKFVLLSSVKAVGEIVSGEIDEAAPSRPTTPYGKAKLNAENILQQFSARHPKLTAVALRPVPVYGVQAQGIIGMMNRQGKNGLLPNLRFPTGQRSYISVNDLARATLAVTDLPAGFRMYYASESRTYSYQDLRSQLQVGKPWTFLLPPLFPIFAKVARVGKLGAKLRLDERLLLDCIVLSKALQRDTGWKPTQDVGDLRDPGAQC